MQNTWEIISAIRALQFANDVGIKDMILEGDSVGNFNKISVWLRLIITPPNKSYKLYH